jgi:hypothetical protein
MRFRRTWTLLALCLLAISSAGCFRHCCCHRPLFPRLYYWRHGYPAPCCEAECCPAPCDCCGPGPAPLMTPAPPGPLPGPLPIGPAGGLR